MTLFFGSHGPSTRVGPACRAARLDERKAVVEDPLVRIARRVVGGAVHVVAAGLAEEDVVVGMPRRSPIGANGAGFSSGMRGAAPSGPGDAPA